MESDGCGSWTKWLCCVPSRLRVALMTSTSIIRRQILHSSTPSDSAALLGYLLRSKQGTLSSPGRAIWLSNKGCCHSRSTGRSHETMKRLTLLSSDAVIALSYTIIAVLKKVERRRRRKLKASLRQNLLEGVSQDPEFDVIIIGGGT